MSANLVAAIDIKQAGNILRHVESAEALEAGIMNPMAGTRPIRLFSIEEAERFLVLHDPALIAAGGPQVSVNYVDPNHLATWVGDVLGDQELSTGLRKIIASGKAYGFLVPEMKSLIATRIEQCKQVLSVVEPAAK